jgi:hypothetical protein
LLQSQCLSTKEVFHGREQSDRISLPCYAVTVITAYSMHINFDMVHGMGDCRGTKANSTYGNRSNELHCGARISECPAAQVLVWSCA